MGRDRLVSVSNRYGLNGSNPGEDEIIRTWGPLSLLHNGYPVSFPEVERPERGVDHPSKSSARVKKKRQYNYTSTSPLGLRGLFYGEIYLYHTRKKENIHLNVEGKLFPVLRHQFHRTAYVFTRTVRCMLTAHSKQAAMPRSSGS
jgi:hypothetical protein